MRLLIVGHVSTCHPAAEAARAAWPDAEIAILPYGRSSNELPAPAGVVKLDLPPLDGSPARSVAALTRFAGRLWRRYELAVIAQPSLERSRARGVLLSFPLFIGAKRTVVMHPGEWQVSGEVNASAALIDLGRWLLLHGASVIVARLAALVLAQLPVRRTQRGIADRSGAIYLRSDLELAGTRLEAGGSASHTEGIVRAIARRGHPVQFWCTGEIAGMPTDVVDNRLPVIAPANTPTEISELVSGLLQAYRLRRHPAPTGFVYQRYSLNNLAGLLLSKRWNVPLILEANASEVRWRQKWSALNFTSLARTCERLLLSSADVVCAVSENAASQLPASDGRLIVAPNAVDVERFANAQPTRLPFPDDAFVVVFVGLFYPWHGVRHLATAFGRLYARHPDARLLLVGDGEERRLVESILGGHDAEAASLLTGLVPRLDVPRYLAAADVLVSPHADVPGFIGSPIKVFEYMASGKAIVASSLAQIADILRDEETALLTPPGDEHALEAALERLHGDAVLRQRLGDNALTEARRHHSWDARLEAILGNATSLAEAGA